MYYSGEAMGASGLTKSGQDLCRTTSKFLDHITMSYSTEAMASGKTSDEAGGFCCCSDTIWPFSICPD